MLALGAPPGSSPSYAAAPDPDMALNNLERLAEPGRPPGLPPPSHPPSRRHPPRAGAARGARASSSPTRCGATRSSSRWLLEARTMRQWLADELAGGPRRRASRPFTRPRGAAERAPPLQVPPPAAHRLPRPPRRRRPHRDDRGAVPHGRRVSRGGLAMGRGIADGVARPADGPGRDARGPRRVRHGQARRRRAELFLRRRPDLRVRRTARRSDSRGAIANGEYFAEAVRLTADTLGR